MNTQTTISHRTLCTLNLKRGWDREFGAGSGVRTLLPDQQSQPRKQEMTAGVVNHIDLAGIKSRLERGKRHVQLEKRGFLLARLQIGQRYQRTLVAFDPPLEELDVR